MRAFHVTGKEFVADIQAGVPVGIPPTATTWAVVERRARTVARGWLTFAVAGHFMPAYPTVGQHLAASPARVAGVDPAGEDTALPRFVACVAEDTPPQPVGPFVLARRLYWPFSGRNLLRCSKAIIAAPCPWANSTMRRLTRCPRPSSESSPTDRRYLVRLQRRGLFCAGCAPPSPGASSCGRAVRARLG